MFHLLGGKANLVADDFCLGGVELSLVLSNLESAKGLTVGGTEPFGVVEGEQGGIALEGYGTEEGTGRRDMMEGIVVVQDKGGKAMAQRALVAEMDVERIAEVGADSHA